LGGDNRKRVGRKALFTSLNKMGVTLKALEKRKEQTVVPHTGLGICLIGQGVLTKLEKKRSLLERRD